MSNIKLPGIPAQPDPQAGIALPMMRGFPCPVVAPFMGGDDGPQEGMGVGWSNVAGQGVRFFVSVHAEGGFALIAQLDYARYKRLAENLAAAGKQALLTGNIDEQGDNDPLAALAEAYDALKAARDKFSFYEKSHLAKRPTNAKGFEVARVKAKTNRAMADRMDATIRTVAKALMIDDTEEDKDNA